MVFKPKNKVGLRGEREAVKFLKNYGFIILETNYWKKWGEIDIVAQKRNSLRFFEVKTVTRADVPRQTGDEYEPEDNIHPWKRQRLRRVIETYLLDKNVSDDLEWQVDVLSVYLNPNGGVLKIDWLEDITL